MDLQGETPDPTPECSLLLKPSGGGDLGPGPAAMDETLPGTDPTRLPSARLLLRLPLCLLYSPPPVRFFRLPPPDELPLHHSQFIRFCLSGGGAGGAHLRPSALTENVPADCSSGGDWCCLLSPDPIGRTLVLKGQRSEDKCGVEHFISDPIIVRWTGGLLNPVMTGLLNSSVRHSAERSVRRHLIGDDIRR